MNKINIDAFSTLITIYENFISKDECLNLFSYCKNKEANAKNQFYGEGRSSFSLSTHLLDEIKNDLKIKIQSKLDEYAYEFGIEDVSITNSWFNIQDNESMLKQHAHENSIFSGALYINVDEQSSELYFENPNPFVSYFNFSKKIVNPNKFSSSIFKVSPQVGQLVIFPSWVKHGSNYEKNNTKDRMVISFNSL